MLKGTESLIKKSFALLWLSLFILLFASNSFAGPSTDVDAEITIAGKNSGKITAIRGGALKAGGVSLFSRKNKATSIDVNSVRTRPGSKVRDSITIINNNSGKIKAFGKRKHVGSVIY